MEDNEALAFLERLARVSACCADPEFATQCYRAADVARRLVSETEPLARIKEMVDLSKMDQIIKTRQRLRGDLAHGPSTVWIARNPDASLILFDQEPQRVTPEDQGLEWDIAEEWWWSHHCAVDATVDANWFTNEVPAGAKRMLVVAGPALEA